MGIHTAGSSWGRGASCRGARRCTRGDEEHLTGSNGASAHGLGGGELLGGAEVDSLDARTEDFPVALCGLAGELRGRGGEWCRRAREALGDGGGPAGGTRSRRGTSRRRAVEVEAGEAEEGGVDGVHSVLGGMGLDGAV